MISPASGYASAARADAKRALPILDRDERRRLFCGHGNDRLQPSGRSMTATRDDDRLRQLKAVAPSADWSLSADMQGSRETRRGPVALSGVERRMYALTWTRSAIK